MGAVYGDTKDRHLIVVDAKLDNLFLTARQYPKMVLIDSSIDGDILTVTVPDRLSATINLQEVVYNNQVRRSMYVLF